MSNDKNTNSDTTAANVTKPDENTHIGTSKKSRYRVIVKRDLCIGAASCAVLAGNTFAMDDGNLAVLLEGEWDEDEIILAAAQSCPVFAIVIEDVETGKQVFPELED